LNLARREALTLAKELTKRLAEPWEDARVTTTEPAGFKIAPEEQKTDQLYPELVDSLPERYQGAVRYGRTEMLSQSELSREPGVGRATGRPGTQQELRLAAAAFMVPGLEDDKTARPNHQAYFRGLFETCTVPFVITDQTDEQGDVYMIRTVAIQKPEPPTLDDSLRERIVKDIRIKRGYDEAEQQARAFTETVGDGSLEEAFRNNATLREKLGEKALKKPEPFPRKSLQFSYYGPMLTPPRVPDLPYNPDLINACFNLVAQKSEDRPEPTLVYPLERTRQWLVVQLQAVEPVLEPDYESDRPMAAAYVRINRQLDVLRNWFSSEQIKQRVSWIPVAPTGQEGEDETEEAAAF
jgi:hypothetical protein